MQRPTYYPDVLLFAIAIPAIAAFNYYLTYSIIQFNSWLLFTYIVDTLQGYAGWLAVRYFIVYLDKRWVFDRRRLVMQTFGVVAIGLTVISVLTELASWLVKGRSASASFYTFDILIISVWFLLINGVYIALFFFNRWREAEQHKSEMESRLAEEARKDQEFVVRRGRQTLKFPVAEFAAFFVDEEYVVAVHAGSSNFIVDDSLDQLEERLPAPIFFRLNRQFIANRSVIVGFRPGGGGKLMVQLKSINGSPAEVTVSRLKAPAFRRWVDNT